MNAEKFHVLPNLVFKHKPTHMSIKNKNMHVDFGAIFMSFFMLPHLSDFGIAITNAHLMII